MKIVKNKEKNDKDEIFVSAYNNLYTGLDLVNYFILLLPSFLYFIVILLYCCSILLLHLSFYLPCIYTSSFWNRHYICFLELWFDCRLIKKRLILNCRFFRSDGSKARECFTKKSH